MYQKSAHQAMTTPMILVINKVDCAPIDLVGPFEEICNRFLKVVRTSAVTGEGISELEIAVLDVRGLEPIDLVLMFAVTYEFVCDNFFLVLLLCLLIVVSDPSYYWQGLNQFVGFI
jgi:hypothetical protein